MPNHELMGRREAHSLGRKHFFTGKPCKWGHLTLRYTSSGGCLECQNLRTPSSALNAVVPLHASERMFFGNCPGAVVDAHEATMAFRYIELAGWHEAAVAAVRAAEPEMRAALAASREEFDQFKRERLAALRAAK